MPPAAEITLLSSIWARYMPAAWVRDPERQTSTMSRPSAMSSLIASTKLCGSWKVTSFAPSITPVWYHSGGVRMSTRSAPDALISSTVITLCSKPSIWGGRPKPNM